jgi:hypothetical protein
MVSLHRTHPFGDLVTRYRARKHSLSQAKLADVSGIDSTVLSHMCNGRRLEGKHARERVLKVITGLLAAGALKSIDEANSLLRAAKLADLDGGELADARLLEVLESHRKPIPIGIQQASPSSPSPPARLVSETLASQGRPAPEGDTGAEGAGRVPDRAGVRRGGPGRSALRWGEWNPFTVGAPIIYPSAFFGRTRELSRLFGLLRGVQLQNGAVVGPRYIGKTSLLRYMAAITQADPATLRPGQKHDWLPEADKYTWIYVDLRDSRFNTPKLLLSYILEQFGLPTQKKCTLEVFGRMVRERLRLPAVILFDNIDVAVEHYSRLDYEFWVGLSSIALNDAEGRLGFIVSSQETFAQMSSHPVVGSSFFTSIVTSIELGPLTEPEAVELIATSPISFPLRDVSWILTHSKLEPMPLQLMCRERLQLLEAGEEMDDSWRDEALRQINTWSK